MPSATTIVTPSEYRPEAPQARNARAHVSGVTEWRLLKAAAWHERLILAEAWADALCGVARHRPLDRSIGASGQILLKMGILHFHVPPDPTKRASPRCGAVPLMHLRLSKRHCP
jgi:hypothetical protein